MKVERKNVVFTGKFSDLCIQYINYKRSQGFDINHIYQRTLYRLGEYLDTNCETISLPEDIVNQFLNQYSETKIGTQLVYESMIRQFGLFMRNSGIDNVDAIRSASSRCARSACRLTGTPIPLTCETVSFISLWSGS